MSFLRVFAARWDSAPYARTSGEHARNEALIFWSNGVMK